MGTVYVARAAGGRTVALKTMHAGIATDPSARTRFRLEVEKRPGMAELAAQLHNGTGEFAEHLPDALLAEIGRRAADVWRIVPQRLPAPTIEAGASAATSPPRARPLAARVPDRGRGPRGDRGRGRRRVVVPRACHHPGRGCAASARPTGRRSPEQVSRADGPGTSV
jgi:hypothetical protein